MFSHLGDVNEVQSSVASCMKRISTLDITSDGSLKVNRQNLVITNCEVSSTSKEKIKGNGQASFNLVTILEVDDLEDDTESAKASKTSGNAEGFQHGPANGKPLKRHVR